MPKTYKVTAVILSGGKSLRMGRNKAFIQIDGVPMIQRILSTLQTAFPEIIIITNDREPYLQFKVKVYEDLVPDAGVLGGLYTGLFYSSFPYAFTVACDMPFLNPSVINYLIDHLNDYDAVIPKTPDGLQPLHAIYSKRCMDPIKEMLNDGKSLKIIDFYSKIHANIVDSKEFLSLDPGLESFINLNTPEELPQK